MGLIMLRGLLISAISSWLYIPGLLLVIWQTSERNLPTLLAMAGAFSLIASILIFIRWRTLHDTPTTSLRNVAQGYAEVIGTAMTMPNEVGPGPYYLPPVVWFSRPHQKSRDPFLVEDEFGSCTIDPRKAEIITELYFRQQYWYRAIFPGQKVYVLGQLTTVNGHQTDQQRHQVILGTLASWKKDHYEMLRRFDKNGDGKIDQHELKLAKQAAEAVVDDELDYHYRQTSTHLIEKPRDGRPFILSSIPLEKLLQRYSRAMIFHLCAWPILSVIAFTL